MERETIVAITAKDAAITTKDASAKEPKWTMVVAKNVR
jgi:hypothetical protein